MVLSVRKSVDNVNLSMSQKIGLLSAVQAEVLEDTGVAPDPQFVTFISAREARERVGAADGTGIARWVEPADSKLHYRYVTPVARILGWRAVSRSDSYGRMTPQGYRGMSVMQPVLEKLR